MFKMVAWEVFYESAFGHGWRIYFLKKSIFAISALQLFITWNPVLERIYREFFLRLLPRIRAVPKI